MLRAISITLALALPVLLVTRALAGSPEPVPTAGPDEIVFYGQIPAPSGTKVVANFLDVKALELVQCGSAMSSSDAGSSGDVSDFLLRIDAGCAVVGAGVGLCWGDGLCAHLDPHNEVQDPRYDGGKTYDVGLLAGPPIGTPTPLPPIGDDLPVPTARADEIVFYGKIPAPAGTTVTVQFFDGNTLQATVCATTVTTQVHDLSVSGFVLVVPAQCADHRQFPKFCWGEGLCYLYFGDGEHFIGISFIPPGLTIDLGLLSAEGPRPREPNLGGGDVDVLLPETGSGGSASGRGALAVSVVLLVGAVTSGGLALGLRHRLARAER